MFTHPEASGLRPMAEGANDSVNWMPTYCANSQSVGLGRKAP